MLAIVAVDTPATVPAAPTPAAPKSPAPAAAPTPLATKATAPAIIATFRSVPDMQSSLNEAPGSTTPPGYRCGLASAAYWESVPCRAIVLLRNGMNDRPPQASRLSLLGARRALIGGAV